MKPFILATILLLVVNHNDPTKSSTVVSLEQTLFFAIITKESKEKESKDISKERCRSSIGNKKGFLFEIIPSICSG